MKKFLFYFLILNFSFIFAFNFKYKIPFNNIFKIDLDSNKQYNFYVNYFKDNNNNYYNYLNQKLWKYNIDSNYYFNDWYRIYLVYQKTLTDYIELKTETEIKDPVDLYIKIIDPFNKNVQKYKIKVEKWFDHMLITNKIYLYYPDKVSEVSFDLSNFKYNIVDATDFTSDFYKNNSNLLVLYFDDTYKIIYNKNNKKIYIDQFGDIKETNLVVDNINNIKFIKVTNIYNSTYGFATNRILINIKGQTYISDIINPEHFITIDNKTLQFWTTTVKYKNGIVSYHYINPDFSIDDTITFDLNNKFDLKKCWNFNYFIPNLDYLYLKFDKCLIGIDYLEEGITNNVDYILNNFKKDFYKKLKDIKNLQTSNLVKDKKVYEILNLSNYFKYKTQLNNIYEANDYINKLLEFYIKSYLLANNIDLDEYIIYYKNLKKNLEKNSKVFDFYNSLLSFINDKIKLYTKAIKEQKIKIMKELPLYTKNYMYNLTTAENIDVNKNLDKVDYYVVTDKTSDLSSVDDVINYKVNLEKKYLNNQQIKNVINWYNLINYAKLIDILYKLKNTDVINIKVNWINFKNLPTFLWNLDNWYLSFLNDVYDLSTDKIKKYYFYYGQSWYLTSYFYKTLSYNINQPIYVTLWNYICENHSFPYLSFANLVMFKDLIFENDEKLLNYILKNKLSTTIVLNFSYKWKVYNGSLPNVINQVKSNWNDPVDFLIQLYQHPVNYKNVYPTDSLIMFVFYLKNKYKTDINNFNNVKDIVKNYLETNGLYDTSKDFITNLKDNLASISDNRIKILWILYLLNLKAEENNNNLLKEITDYTINYNNKIKFVDYFFKWKQVFLNNGSILNNITDLDTIADFSWLDIDNKKFYSLDNYNSNFYEQYFKFYKNLKLSSDEYITWLKLINNLEYYENMLKYYNDLKNDIINKQKAVLDTLIKFYKENNLVKDSDVINDYNDLVTIVLENCIANSLNEINNVINTLPSVIQNNIKKFGNLQHFLNTDIDLLLNYSKLNTFNNEKTNLDIQSDIIKNINIKNISQYEKYDIKDVNYFNEYWSVLKQILKTKQTIYPGAIVYDDIDKLIEKINDYKNTDNINDLNSYVNYVKDVVYRTYKKPIYDLYDLLYYLNWNKDFDFNLNDYINNLENLQKTIEKDFNIKALKSSIYTKYEIVYNPGKSIDKNTLYESLVKKIDNLYKQVKPYVIYNEYKNKLEQIKKEINNFSKYKNDLTFDRLSLFYNSLKKQLENIDLDSLPIDTSDLKKDKNKLNDDIDKKYNDLIDIIKNNISEYFKKYFYNQKYALYSAKTIDELDKIYNNLLNQLDKALGVGSDLDKCIINSDKWLYFYGLKTGEICWNLLDTSFGADYKTDLTNLYNKIKQGLSNNIYEVYFKSLLKIYPNALNEIFDWTSNTLKDNKDISFYKPSSGTLKSCELMIYKNIFVIGLKCKTEQTIFDKPTNVVDLEFKDLIDKVYRYELVSQNTTNLTYKTNLLKIKNKNYVMYLKSYYIPNNTISINIYKDGTSYIYWYKKFDKPFLTSINVDDLTSKINYQISQIKDIEIDENQYILNDKLLTLYINNNIWQILSDINILKNMVKESVVNDLYNKLKDKLNDIGFKDLPKDLNTLSEDKENIFNALNLINNLTLTSYKTQLPVINSIISKIVYFKDAKKYITYLLNSKVNSFEEFENNLLFQEKIKEFNKKLNKMYNFVGDTILDNLDNYKKELYKYIDNNFPDPKVNKELKQKVDDLYKQIKNVIEKNIEYKKYYIDANNEMEWKTEVTNILTDVFKTKFVEQILENKILKGLYYISNNQYKINNTLLKQVKEKFEITLDIKSDKDYKKINIKSIKDKNDFINYVTMKQVFDTNISNFSNKMMYFDYMATHLGKYNIPIDIVEADKSSSWFFEGMDVSSSDNKNKIKNILYEVIKAPIINSDGSIVGYKDIYNDIVIFLPDKKVKLDLNNEDYLTIIRNLSDQKVNLNFYKKDGTPLYLNDYIVKDIAKFIKNYNNNIQGIVTEILEITNK